jgi:hypothetical protein
MSWATHFQAISKGAPTASFGTTLFGKYTVAELQDILNAKDDEMANLAKYAGSASSGWQSDFKALQADYAKARDAGLAAIASAKYSIFSDALNSDGDSYYRQVLATLNPRWEQHDASTDRVGILLARLKTEGKTVAPYAVRQPRAGSDAAAQMTAHPAQYFIQQPIQAAAGAAESAGSALATWSRPVVIAVAAIAGVMGFFLIKSYLPAPHRQLGTNLERSTS